MRQRLPGDDETADVLREMAGETQNGGNQGQELPHQAAVGVEPGLAELFAELVVIVPPGEGLGQEVEQVRIHAERLAHVADGAAQPVGDERRGQCRPLAPVALVDVLDDLLAPLVLEINVDVRRFVALPGDEALEQQVHAGRVDLGDVQAETDRRVGRRPAPLAEDVLAAGKLDDVLHREEIVLVVEGPDEFEFPADKTQNIVGNALRPAFARTGQGELFQVLERRQVRGNQFLGVPVAQLVHGKTAEPGNVGRLVEEFARVEFPERRDGPQGSLGVAERGAAQFGHRGLQADGGHHVLQRLPHRVVGVHVVAGHEGQAEPHGKRERVGGLVQVAAFPEKLQGDPEPAAPVDFAGEGIETPRGYGRAGGRAGEQGLDAPAVGNKGFDGWSRSAPGYPERQAGLEAVAEIFEFGPVFALGGTPPQPGDEPGKLAVGATVGRQQDEFAASIVEFELGADDELDAVLSRSQVRLGQAGERTLVGDGDGRIAELRGPLDQLFRMRSAAQEAVVAQAVEFREGPRRLPGPCALPGASRLRTLSRNSHAGTSSRPAARMPSPARRSRSGLRSSRESPQPGSARGHPPQKKVQPLPTIPFAGALDRSISRMTAGRCAEAGRRTTRDG